MRIEYQNVTLRDMIESDIEDYVRWFTTETNWADYDAPWEKLRETSIDQERAHWKQYYLSTLQQTSNRLRRKFEIESDGRHIGWVNSYFIDEKYNWISPKQVNTNQTVYTCIGINICASDVWGKGIGTNALQAFINYHLSHNITELYIQTWSGNIRMLRCAEKLGFVLCNRVIDKRLVNNQKYDALTLKRTYFL